MKLLEDMILKRGRVLDGNILKVDNFLNHQIDPDLFMEMGKDYYDHFKDKEITKILTLEVSGIAIAFAAATYFKVPLVFAKKSASLTLSDDTKKKEYDIKVDRNFLSGDDKVLIIDDFLATGQALKGLVSLCDQAGAEVAGIGIAIEKTFQNGGKLFRDKGYDVYSQAMIKAFENNSVIFE